MIPGRRDPADVFDETAALLAAPRCPHHPTALRVMAREVAMRGLVVRCGRSDCRMLLLHVPEVPDA